MSYIHFIGIDVSKDVFDAGCHGTPHRSARFPNDASGFAAFAAAYADLLPTALVVLEATGGYETALLTDLANRKIPVHQAHPLQAKHFIRSLGRHGKTDRLDALALARYGAERHASLPLWSPPEASQQELADLQTRRGDLIAMRVAEQTRRQHPRYRDLTASIDTMLATIRAELQAIEARIAALVTAAPGLATKRAIMTTVSGVGQQTAHALLAAMPELGTMNRRQAASLAGLAPHPKDSGMTKGYRPTSGGRQDVRKALFMAAMSAIRAKKGQKDFYQRLIQNGKKPMVALTAVMRKIITIINAKIRDANLQQHGR
jgi:transposase